MKSPDEGKDWLGRLDWPGTAYEDFDQIRKFDERFYQITGIKAAATQPTTHGSAACGVAAVRPQE